MTDAPRSGYYNPPSEEEATSLAFTLAEAADEGEGPIRGDDGVVRAPWLSRRGDRLFARGEPETFYDLSADGAPRTRIEDGADLPHRVRHHEAPVIEIDGWHRAADGWVLISSEGTSWTPEAYVPDEEQQ